MIHVTDVQCPICEGAGQVHDADFSDGDSDQQMYLMQDTLRSCEACGGSGMMALIDLIEDAHDFPLRNM